MAISDFNYTEKLAVNFQVSGGTFVFVRSEEVGPDLLIEENVIFVTVNYRVGPFGFLSLGTREYSGNMGLKDIRLALKWIYNNIEHFGGDKTRITINGGSSGIFIEFSQAYLFNTEIVFVNARCTRVDVESSTFIERRSKKLLSTCDFDERHLVNNISTWQSSMSHERIRTNSIEIHRKRNGAYRVRTTNASR